MTEKRVQLDLTEDEVIVLFEWLQRVNKMTPDLVFQDQAEQRAAWDLEASLEPVNRAIFSGSYLDQLRAARDRVHDSLE